MTRLALLSGLGHAVLVAASLLLYVMATRIGQQRRHPSTALAWVVGLVAFPYVALPLFLLFGTRKFARPARHQRAPAPAADMPAGAPAWATRLLSGMELAPAVPNDAVAFHADGAASLQALIGLIDSAEHSLDLCTFLFGNDAVGRSVTDALLRCARRGVTTHVLLDAVGGLQTPAPVLRQWAGGGVRVRRFMPLLHNPLRGRTNLRNHRKLAVADGVRLWSGGRNLASEYFTDRPGRPAWTDLSFTVHGPLAAQALAQFRTDWRAARGRPHRAARILAPPVAPERSGGALAQWVPSGPDHADDTLHALLMSGAYQAQQRIWAATPYFVPDDALLDAWCLACRRGVQVRLLLPRRSNHRLADWARERALRQLVAAGGEVWLAPTMLHAKTVLIDGELALCGSLNLDARSLFLNYEAMAAFYGLGEVQWLSDWFEHQRALAQPYRARPPSWARDIFEGVVRAVGFQL
ncbi:cardiolipin synthase [Rhodococcus sp. SRB_17]|uniref:phospholipase D-like domain-containing protein n=1 Tax=Acidovorax sp. SRB_24 TaxID=1962700 RepID=UPI00145EE9C0|nr:phospholipase D-like domain-containing protein [Acidovorax sp. SRB_24]NMM76632.1 cardiolipin synthase [Acidovorax sp. SRB_24]NMM89890.1 cardiolipin synthase [Rhodococcus sp. SRB_17]